ncbi:MAG: hypothetical protein IRY91_07250 [Gemmatimonadaceae bacterium]|nr:hypothetical protein [Gemmatimonadaceae bacterium]
MAKIDRRRPDVRRVRNGVLTALLIGAAAACSPDRVVGGVPLPSNLSDPAAMGSRSGALAVYNGTLAQFRDAFGGFNGTSFIEAAGELSDELQNGTALGATSVTPNIVDVRVLPEAEEPNAQSDAVPAAVYSELQRVRGQARQGVGLLRDYAPDVSHALLGHLYALMGYSEVMLAELYCSGIPLSTLDYNGDYTLAPGSSTAEVLTHARALFDTALALSADSARILHLARVGKGRALLGLGDFAGAAAAVADVPDGYRYEVTYSGTTETGLADPRNFATVLFGRWAFSVSDVEGGTGLDYISSGDPRTAVVPAGKSTGGISLFSPVKYAPDGGTPIVLADGVEARLIEAEAALHGAGGNWLAILNALRTDGTFDTQPDPVDATKVDTLWHAGSGGVAGLAPLSDPGTDSARVDLVFRERAFWLFLTGHRQGDLRRLIRQYGRQPDDVYPVGPYPAAGGTVYYGTDVTMPIPATERIANSKFTGCINRDA